MRARLRRFISVPVVLAAVTLVHLASCGRGEGAREQVVLYSSADDYVLRAIIDAFEAQTGIDVLEVTDTEATKTTGLVTRLLAERDRPRADVWWSSEPFGTIRLAREGVLEPTTVEEAEGAFADGWPEPLRGPAWYGFAQRARVIVYSTDRVAEPPTTLRELADETWHGRVGMARPAFGTTRGHAAALVDQWGPDGFEAWLEAMRRGGLRIYDGNATVVRAVANGEIDVGLTDTDDVFSGQRNGWPVDLVYEARGDAGDAPWPSFGPMVIPNTVARVAGGPNEDAARVLIAFLLSPEAERILAESDSRNIPVRPELAELAETLMPSGVPALDLERVAARVPEAMAICERVLTGP